MDEMISDLSKEKKCGNIPQSSLLTTAKTLMSVAMNKGQVVEAVQSALGDGASKKDAEQAVAAVLNAIAKGIKKDGTVQLIGFGTFVVRKRAARMGRNPKSGAAMQIKASKSVGFKPSSALKGSL